MTATPSTFVTLPWEHAAKAAADIWGFHLTTENGDDPEFLALQGVYKDILTSRNPRLTNPLIINMIICCDKECVRWRTGIPAEFKGLPKAECCQQMFKEWWRALDGKSLDIAAPIAQRERFCLAQFCEFLCIRPFRNGNGRCALVLFYTLRLIHDLPFRVVTADDIGEMNAAVREYRKSSFIPRYASTGQLGRL